MQSLLRVVLRFLYFLLGIAMIRISMKNSYKHLKIPSLKCLEFFQNTTINSANLITRIYTFIC